jgi:hypothetical protein
MQTMFKMPNDPIAEPETVILEDVIELNIQRKNFTVLDVIPDLPAQRSVRMQQANTL